MDAKENMLRAIQRDRPQWVPNNFEAVIEIRPPLLERPRTAGLDAFAVHWTLDEQAEGGTYPTHGGHTVDDVDRWQETISLPAVDSLRWDEIRNQAESVDRERYLIQAHIAMGLFERSYLLLGMEDALVAYLSRPAVMYDLLAAIADYKIALIRSFHVAVGLDIVWYGDDWGTQRNLFLPPQVWREVIMPHTARIFAAIKELGVIANLHSCGRIDSVFEDVVKMGADIWNPCQPCNDLTTMKRTYGDRIAFWGGLDSQFVLGRPGVTPDQVRMEVRKRIDAMADGGGYIAAPSHDVPYAPDIVAAMNDEIATYGRNVYAS